MSGVDVALVAAGAALIGAVVTGLLARRSASEANTTTAWSALVKGLQEEVGLLRSQQAQLRVDVDAVKDDLARERRARQSLAEVLRSAWSHILRLGDQIRDLGGHPEPAPPDLTAFMRSDGLVVDRVETTISRTTVTDTRDHHDQQLEQVVVEMPPLDNPDLD